MSTRFLGEIRQMSFQYAPRGWALCNGQFLPINQNQALFALLGTTFGGDGRVNFALPDYRGRVPMHVGSGFTLGQRGGEEGHTISLSELPGHTHVLNASASQAGVNTEPAGSLPRGESHRCPDPRPISRPLYGLPSRLQANPSPLWRAKKSAMRS